MLGNVLHECYSAWIIKVLQSRSLTESTYTYMFLLLFTYKHKYTLCFVVPPRQIRMLIEYPNPLSLTWRANCKTYTVYPPDIDDTVCYKTINKSRNVWMLIQCRSYFFYSLWIFRVDGRGRDFWHPVIISNPDMSAAIKPCAFQLLKDKPWLQR